MFSREEADQVSLVILICTLGVSIINSVYFHSFLISYPPPIPRVFPLFLGGPFRFTKWVFYLKSGPRRLCYFTEIINFGFPCVIDFFLVLSKIFNTLNSTVKTSPFYSYLFYFIFLKESKFLKWVLKMPGTNHFPGTCIVTDGRVRCIRVCIYGLLSVSGLQSHTTIPLIT